MASKSIGKLDQLLETLADNHVTSISTEDEERLEKELKSELKVEDEAELNSEHLWDAIDKSDHRLVIENGNKEYLQAVRVVWKIFDYICGSQDRLLEAIPKIAERANMKITAKFDPLIATFRSTIKYGDRRLWSRDAQAVRWLKRQNETADTFIEFQDDNGGGVYTWSREWQKLGRDQKAAAGGKVKPKLKTAAQRVTKLRAELKDGQRAVLMVKMMGTALVYVGCKIIKKADKKIYWPKIKKVITGVKSTKA